MDYPIAAQASESARAAFIRRTYAHLAVAVLAFAGVEALLLQLPGIDQIVRGMTQAWIGVILLMMGAGWVARYWARAEAPPAMQYAGLALYVLAEAIIFLPLLYVVSFLLPNSDGLIATAGIYTVAIFAGLTLTVFLTRSDYSYLYPVLSCASFLVMGLIVCSIFFPITLGTWFSFFMVALACGFILYSTSNIMHHYRTDQHVGAALELFAAVALLFWYILRILAASRD
jgi:FtsH-binding integral membrane protein